MLESENWDAFVNDDDLLFGKLAEIARGVEPVHNGRQLVAAILEPPIQSQELWASGVTYFRSKQGRQEESKNVGGGVFSHRLKGKTILGKTIKSSIILRFLLKGKTIKGKTINSF